MKMSTMSEAIGYLQQYIVPPSGIFQGQLGLKRMELFMNLLGNPQDKVKIIHVAGTSGKGSTCYYISNMLNTAGLKVGLTVSPHIHDIRERIQINNQLISEKDFCFYLQEMIPAIDKMKSLEIGAPTYFEIMMALAFFVFHKNKVDYAVIETGMGGLFDASNVVHSENKVAVITRVGLDHTKVLGNTLSKIAVQKAKIIQNKNKVFSIDQRSSVQKIIEKEAAEKSTHVTFLKKDKTYKNIRINNEEICFDFYGEQDFKNVVLNSHALYQVENTSLAIDVALFLSKRDGFILNKDLIQKALKSTLIPGRMELFHIIGKSVMIDGAHNPQKMRAFLQSLKKLYPEKKFEFLLAFKKDKEVAPMIKMIIPYAKKITITSFFVNDTMMNISAKPQEILKTLVKYGFKNTDSIPDPLSALEKIIKESNSIIVITGSMYLVGEIYNELTSRS